MFRSVKFTLSVVGLLVVTASQVSAGFITTVPTSLNPGDSYRLAFVTSTTRTARSSDITVYNAFVDALGDGVIASDWRAIASTPLVDAIDNTGTRFTSSSPGDPIFLLNDIKIADDYSDLWDGSIDFPLNVNEAGDRNLDVVRGVVFTGSEPDGSGRDFFELGGLSTQAKVGLSRVTDGEWMNAGQIFKTTPLHFFAISGVLTVPTTSTPVPEPGSWLLMSIGAVMLMGVGGLRRRKRASELTGPNPPNR